MRLFKWIAPAVAGAALAIAAPYAASAQNFDDPKEFQAAQDLLKMTPSGPEGKPWEQNLGGKEVDTSKYKKPGPYRICFSNAGVDNPWRVVGWINMQAQVDVLKDDIKSFKVADAQGKDDKQISDINAFVQSGDCDALIVSPNTTAALTPAVEAACKKLPVIVFDRGVLTTCPVTFVNPIGGYGWGIQTADFIVSKLPKGGKVLALRILPGVDVLETRWSAANRIFKENGVNVVGAEFTGGDNAKTKSIVEDYINKLRQDRRGVDGRRRDRGRRARSLRGCRPALSDHHRRGSGGLPEEVEGEGSNRDGADLSDLSVALAGHRRGEDPQGRAGDRPDLEAAAAGHHPGRPRQVRRRQDAAAALRDVRLQGPARLSAALGRQVNFPTEPEGAPFRLTFTISGSSLAVEPQQVVLG